MLTLAREIFNATARARRHNGNGLLILRKKLKKLRKAAWHFSTTINESDEVDGSAKIVTNLQTSGVCPSSVS